MNETTRRSERRRPRVERLANDFARFARDLEPLLLRRAPALNPDIQECAASILANFGEGWDESSRGDKVRFFRYAHRSAGEAERLIRAARVLGAIPEDKADDGVRLLLGIKMDLVRLMNSLRP